MMAEKVVDLGFEIISKLDSNFLMTVRIENTNISLGSLLGFFEEEKILNWS